MWQHLPCQFPTLRLQSAKLTSWDERCKFLKGKIVFFMVSHECGCQEKHLFILEYWKVAGLFYPAPCLFTLPQLDLTFRQWHAVSPNTHLHDSRADHFHLFLASGGNVNIPSSCLNCCVNLLPLFPYRHVPRVSISAWQQSVWARLLVALIRLSPLINPRPQQGWSRRGVPSSKARAAVSRGNQNYCWQTTWTIKRKWNIITGSHFHLQFPARSIPANQASGKTNFPKKT